MPEYIGPFRILNLVAVGQTCRLYHAIDDQRREPVAVKTLQEKFLGDKNQVALLKREFEVAGSLSHPRLVGVRTFAYAGQTPYLTLQWCPGSSLKALINKGYSEYAPSLTRIIPEMVDALAYLHQHGWIHRDVKPDNFLYSEEMGTQLLDFAIAQKKPSILSRLTGFLKKKVQGTASYMSPEQIRNQPVNEPADLYSWGCTVFELLSGRPPYTGGSMNELLQKHLSSSIPVLSARNSNVTPEFVEIVKSCMNKLATDRPQSSLELCSMLQRVKIFKRPPTETDIS